MKLQRTPVVVPAQRTPVRLATTDPGWDARLIQVRSTCTAPAAPETAEPLAAELVVAALRGVVAALVLVLLLTVSAGVLLV